MHRCDIYVRLVSRMHQMHTTCTDEFGYGCAAALPKQLDKCFLTCTKCVNRVFLVCFVLFFCFYDICCFVSLFLMESRSDSDTREAHYRVYTNIAILCSIDFIHGSLSLSLSFVSISIIHYLFTSHNISH